jgi:hypothetical protein
MHDWSSGYKSGDCSHVADRLHAASPGKTGNHILNRSTPAVISALGDVLWYVRKIEANQACHAGYSVVTSNHNAIIARVPGSACVAVWVGKCIRSLFSEAFVRPQREWRMRHSAVTEPYLDHCRCAINPEPRLR